MCGGDRLAANPMRFLQERANIGERVRRRSNAKRPPKRSIRARRLERKRNCRGAGGRSPKRPVSKFEKLIIINYGPYAIRTRYLLLRRQSLYPGELMDQTTLFYARARQPDALCSEIVIDAALCKSRKAVFFRVVLIDVVAVVAQRHFLFHIRRKRF